MTNIQVSEQLNKERTASQAAALGIYAKLRANKETCGFPIYHFSTPPPIRGEINPLANLPEDQKKFFENIFSESSNFGHSRSKWDLQDTAVRILGSKRLRECLRAPIAPTVSILSHISGKCHYKNLSTCGSVWVCPICSAKISERRRIELKAAIAGWNALGNSVFLMTVTFPHYAEGPRLAQLLEAFGKALSKFSAHRKFKDWKETLGVVGTIRALEVTHGLENGWHPHAHFLVFAEGQPDDLKTDDLFDAWKTACRLAGLPAPGRKHGIDIQDGSYAAGYAAKWGLDCELTKAHIKRGRGSRTPWDLLRDADVGDAEAAELFREYAETFKGRKQLHWSRGLRALLKIGEERSDEELAKESDEPSSIVASLTLSQWRSVIKLALRGQLLEVAAAHGAEGVALFLGALPRSDLAEIA